MEYLFDKWDKPWKKIEEKFVFLFLDYDGTLTPIAGTPEKATLPESTREALVRLLTDPKVKIAIISGRQLNDIKERVDLRDIIYVGNHGLEIEGPKIKFKANISQSSRAALGRIKEDLNEKLSQVKGVVLEDKGFSLALHYRLVDEKLVSQVRAIFREVVMPYLVRNKIKVKSGKKVLEAGLPVEWDKGKVVLWLIARQEFFLGGKDIFPVYFGDDKTDEDAFKALRKKGLTIFVGKPQDSCAEYYVNDYKEVAEFLRRLCRN